MRALLRLQGVVLARTITRPIAILQLVALAAFIAWTSSDVAGPVAAVAVAFAVMIAVGAMSQTFEAVDSVRWIAPMRRGDAVRAHVVFWLAVCGPPAAIVAIARAPSGHDAAILFLHLALVVVAAATLVMFYQRITRRGSGAGAMVAGVVVGSVLVWPAGWSLYLAWTGRWQSLIVIGVIACIGWALGVPQFLRGELDPAATGDVVEGRPACADDLGLVLARTPAATLLRATFPPVLTFFWILFGGVLPLLFSSLTAFAIWTPIAASNLAGFGLQSWRWLAATPIDRNRAFRVLFGPALALMLVVTATKLVVVEVSSDRSVFFRDDRREGFRHVGSSTLTLSELLETGPTGNGYRPAELHRVAAGVSDHLRDQFGAELPLERIEADLARGWPRQPTAGHVDDDMAYVLDGLERVRVDLADELASASRRRDIVLAGAFVLAFLVLLRSQFGARRLGLIAALVCIVPLATLPLYGREFPALAAARGSAYVALTGASPVVFGLGFAAACFAGALLWLSSRKAFRRIDLLDLPPATPAWMRA